MAALPARAAPASLIVNFNVVPSHVPEPGGTTVVLLPVLSIPSIAE